MATKTRDLRFTLPARDESISVARHRVGEHMEALGCAADRVVDGMIAVGEAAGNSASHAYRDRESGEIRFGVVPEGSNVVVTVSDQGCGPGPNLASAGRSLGVPMMAVLADRLTITGDPERARRSR